MRLIPVLDLMQGRAVHARGGDRSQYAPVESVLAPGAPGDAVTLAKAYRTSVGAGACYVADLDALAGRAAQRELLRATGAAFGGELWIDAGADTVALVEELATQTAPAGRRREIVAVMATEWLRSWDDVRSAVAMLGAARVVCSLDFRHGHPLGTLRGSPAEMARAAVGAGVRRLVVLDVGRVGRGDGPPGSLLRAVRTELDRRVELVAGGGVRDAEDLQRLAAEGVSAVLVASALHDGRLVPGGATGAGQQARRAR